MAAGVGEGAESEEGVGKAAGEKVGAGAKAGGLLRAWKGEEVRAGIRA